MRVVHHADREPHRGGGPAGIGVGRVVADPRQCGSGRGDGAADARFSNEDGVLIEEIPLPDNALIAAVASGGDVEVANADTLLFPGDKAIVVADEDVLDEVRQAFRGL